MFYLLLFLAIILEVILAVFFLNLTNGFTNFVPTVFRPYYFLFFDCCFICYLTPKGEVGVAKCFLYAENNRSFIVVTGIIFFDETISLSKILGVSLIELIGAVSL